MHTLWALTARPNNWFDQSSSSHGVGQLSSAFGLCAMAAMIAVAVVKPAGDEETRDAGRAAAASSPNWAERLMDPNRAIGAYGGISYTYPDTIRIKKDGSEVTVRGFDWIGKPFVAPIYYGARVWRWSPFGRFGTMVDFTHAKAIAKPDSVAQFMGTHNGKPLPKSAPIKDVFSKLEFSHGHNILTYNGLLRLGTIFGRVRPYVGVGAGVSLPHTEIGFAKDNTRTFEYQFAGFAGQGIAGIEIDLGQTSLFLEYKFTYAPHDVPLSHERNGSVLPVDLWRQFSTWWRGEKPPGGRLSINLTSHHGVAGVMVKTGRGAVPARP
jgi:lipid A oxidase